MSNADFEVIEADWELDSATLSEIRFTVFVEEQGFAAEIELDGVDQECGHVLCRTKAGKAAGTGRLLPDGHLGRIAVLKEFRGRGMGAAITEKLVELAKLRGFAEAALHSQVHACPFYARLGFEPVGAEFEEAGAPHQSMVRRLKG